jgi:hypothetical protein
VRATSRLVLVWTSISLVAVAVGWAALGSAIGTGSPEPVEVAALDPSVLAPSPPQVSSAPTALPSSVMPSPRAGDAVVTRTGRRTKPKPTRTPSSTPTPPASPSSTPSPAASEPSPDAPHRHDPRDRPPDEVVREVDTECGSATIGYSGDRVYLLDYEPAPGHATQGDRRADDYIVVRFLSRTRSSTIHAFVDGEGALRTEVFEEKY